MCSLVPRPHTQKFGRGLGTRLPCTVSRVLLIHLYQLMFADFLTSPDKDQPKTSAEPLQMVSLTVYVCGKISLLTFNTDWDMDHPSYVIICIGIFGPRSLTALRASLIASLKAMVEWNGISNVTVQLQLTHVTGTAQSRFSYLIYL